MYASSSRIIVVGVIAFISFGLRDAHGINIILESFINSTHPLILNGTANDSGVPLGEDPPGFDSDSSSLLNVLQEVELEFQDALEDPFTIRITYLWDTNSPFSGQSNPSWVVEDPNTGQITHAIVRFDPARNWYVDPTPESDSEYVMDQVLYSFGSNSLAAFEQTLMFQVLAPGDAVPAVFEAGYNGLAVTGGPADADAGGAQLDLLTVAFQEVGHSLGMSSGYPGNIVLDSMNNPVSGAAADGLWQFDPDWVAGQQIATNILGMGTNGPFAHLPGQDAVMSSLNSGERTRPSAADYMSIASIQGWTTIDLSRQDFLSGPNWNTAGSWMGNQIPGSADAAFVRHGGTVTVDVGATVESLQVDNASTVDLGSALLFADEVTIQRTVGGGTPRILVGAGGTILSDAITIDFGARLQLDGGTVNSNRLDVLSGGQLQGYGTVDLSGAFSVLTSNGTIRATDGNELEITAENAMALDLVSGTIEAIDGDLRFGTGMLSPMGAVLTVGAGRQVAFDAVGSIGDGGLLNLVGQPGSPAVSTGVSLFVSDGGTVNANGLGVVENSLVLQPNGFITTQVFDPDSEIRLVGTTFYQGGGILGPGFARQNGNAFFNADTEININTYDMDGQAGNTTLNISPGVTVTINSPKIEVAADNAFDGTLNNNGGTLHMEHDWQLDGVLNLTQDGGTAELVGPGRVTVSTNGTINVSGAGRIDSPITLAGTLSVGSVVDLNGDTIITATAQLETNNPNDAINLYGTTVIGGGSYAGGGLLRFQGSIQVIGNTTIGMAQADLDGTGLGGSLSIAPGVTLSVSSTTLDPADDDYDDTMNLRGTFSTLVPLELTGTINMIREGRATVPQINGLTSFTIHPGGEVDTDGDAQINRDTTVQGDLRVGAGVTQINAGSILFESTANVAVAEDGTLELNGPTAYEGGFHGGQGLIQFNGTTNINDDTTISAARVDLDGAAENTVLNLNDSQLTLNVDQVDTTNVQYNGLANVVGENARLAVNLNTPMLGWRLMSDGQLNFSNPAPSAPTVTMLSGSGLLADGVINAVGPLTLAADVAVRNRLNVQTGQTNVHFGGPTRSTIHANLMATVTGLGQITIDNGTTLNLEDQSQVAVDTTNRGRLEIGFEASELSVDYSVPATATIRGFFAQTLSGELAVDLGGTTQATEYDWLEVLGMARLSGTVVATFIDDYVPAVGTIFTILTATDGRDGEFDNVEAIDENGVLRFVVTDLYTATEAMLRVDDIFLLGDFDMDGDVDGRDFLEWQRGNSPNPLSAADLAIWHAQYGQSLGPLTAATAVPEPGVCGLAVVAALMLLVRNRSC